MILRTLLTLVAFLLTTSCYDAREDRARLFDDLLAKTLERESFAPIKKRTLGLDVESEMRRFRDELLDADTDEKLYYALVKISNARKDRHLRVSLVEGGLALEHTTGVQLENYPVPGMEIPHAPIRFMTDYGDPDAYFLFVSDFARDIGEITGGIVPDVGDRLLSVNDQPIADYVEAIQPYHRYSTINGFWWQLATWIPQKSYQFPPSFYRDDITYELERRSGEHYTLSLPYRAPETIDWSGLGDRSYPGFRRELATETYDLYRSETGKAALLLDWHGFREDLTSDVDRLVDYAVENDLLDYAVIFDGTRSRGGSGGAYAVQRLSSRPFKTTFGNLRLSDITPAFIEQTLRDLRADGRAEPDDARDWLTDWLENDVREAIRAGREYSGDVPFKLAHAPKDSDGILQPAEIHFRGPMVCFFGPYGGSHLDQFASIVIDNRLAYTLGMSCAGYSNTWEWEEVVSFPISRKPIVRFMWSIGHTLRPNGEILEGNPASVDEYIPLTRDNYLDYYPRLVSRALEHLGIE